MQNIQIKRDKFSIIKSICLLMLIFITTVEVKADNRYWISSADSNWNNIANWSTTSGGVGGASVPMATDVVYFDGGSSSNCTVDIPVTIEGLIIYFDSFSTLDINGQSFNITGASNNFFHGGTIDDGVGASTFSINCTGMTTFLGTTIGANITVASARIFLNGSTFNGTSSFEKTGAGADWGEGGNTFNDITQLINSGDNTFATGNTNPDIFNTNLTLTNTGSHDLVLASNTVGNQINGNLTTINSSSSLASSIILASTTSAALNVTGTCVVTNNGSGPNITTHVGLYGDVTFGGTLTLRNLGTGVDSYILAHTNLGSNNFYNGGIVFECNQPNKGIRFGQNNGEGTLGNGQMMSIGALGFNTAFLWLKNFTQIGTTSQTIELTGTADFAIQSGTIFNGNVNFTSPRFRLGGGTFNGTTTIFHKTGTTYDWCFGGGAYNTNLEIKNSGTGTLDMANTAVDDYNGDVTYTKNSTGLILGANNTACTYAGDINFNTNSDITLATNTNGRVIMDGAGVQNINNTGTTPSVTFRRLTVNKTGGNITLNFPIRAELDLAFTQGFMITTPINLLTINDNILLSGASDLSFVSGPVKKIGNDIFTFPVGDITTLVYAPVTISAPTNTWDAFTATYFNTNPNSATYDVTSKDLTLDHVSQCEYWTVDRTTGTSDVSVTLSWDARSCGVTDLSELRVARWDGTKWNDHGNGGTTGGLISGTVISSGLISTFSPFTLASTTASNPLPIDLLSFDAKLIQDGVQLKWTTASEVDNDYFTIEKSGNGISWIEVFIEKGAGNSTQINNYFKIDEKPLDGTSYYRLKQTDFDGDYTYSKVITIKFEQNIIEIYPNPTKGSFEIIGLDMAEISIIDNYGRIVREQTMLNQNIDISDLPNGLYYISINTKKGAITKRIIKK